MKRVLWGIEAIILFVLVLLLTNHFSNEIMIDHYNNKEYQENNITFLGVLEPYIAPYNLGNVYYQRCDYESAIAKYQEALQYNPPEGYDCKIRINEVLAMVATIDADSVDVKNYDETIDYLQSAQAILCEHGCASMEGSTGHNKDAQQLKEDIDKFIYELGIKVSFVKNDENGESLSGATLQILDENEQILYEWTSDGTKFTEIRFLIGKSYIYREVKAPEGYKQAEDIMFTIEEDGTVTYNIGANAQDASGNEVTMVDQKQESENSNNGEEQEPQNQDTSEDEKDEENETNDTEPQVEEQLQDIQNQSQEEREEEISNDEGSFNYEFSYGPSW